MRCYRVGEMVLLRWRRLWSLDICSFFVLVMRLVGLMFLVLRTLVLLRVMGNRRCLVVGPRMRRLSVRCPLMFVSRSMLLRGGLNLLTAIIVLILSRRLVDDF